MNRYWILVADSGQARIFAKANRVKPLELVEDLTHPESREKRQDLTSDRPGHYQSKGTGHGAFVETDPKKHEADVFARQIADRLGEALHNQRFEQLILAAPPKFHGMLNKHMSKQVSAAITTVMSKDYTHMTEQELGRIIDEAI